MKNWPRVAFFSDSYHGVDGVATTCRNIVAAARRRELPFFAVHAAERNSYSQEGSLEILELDRGPISFPLDLHLRFDLLFTRHYNRVLHAVREFRPDVVHITGPGDVGITGARVAYALGLPLVASWHTNLHEFAARRLWKFASLLPEEPRKGLTYLTQKCVLRACLRFYKLARVILAPNEEHMRLIGANTGKPVFPMQRGVDAQLFSPVKRDVCDRIFRLGYVGRLRPEKNVRFLAEIEDSLRRDGLGNYRFLIVGDGSERAWLERRLRQADFTGELFGEALARAYANMDLFVFPSETDTFGNVVTEAMASGTPAVVTSKGGPKFQVQNGVTGFVSASEQDFIARIKQTMASPQLHRSLRVASRLAASRRSWENVLDDLRQAYQACLWQSESQPASAVLTPIA
ncbi:MAG TPA: glycosyltransferase [Candidatus Acidoferrales bacterium]|jgi:glycosyltransferase involved in cell wall biosynthesis|nr:glycosyltransferase [Candidatus Acidoferrales bacterium]